MATDLHVVPMVMLVVISYWTPTSFGIKPNWTIANYRSVFTEPVYLSVTLPNFAHRDSHNASFVARGLPDGSLFVTERKT